jgi:UDP-N-acetylmuramate dehydrogenase
MHPALEGTGIAEADATPNAPLAPWTSVRVGGAAEVLVRPKTSEQLVRLLERVRTLQLPLTILGGGANTLVSDAGVAGVTVKLPSGPEEIELLPDGRLRLTLSAGTPITRLVTLMRKHQKVGAEFLAGIPGTLGGATRMNAGTKQGECCSLIESVEVATADGLNWLPISVLQPRYRHTELAPGSVLTRMRFVLPDGDLEASKVAMDSDLAYRKRTQPLSEPNFGSVFANPPGDHAGRLLETAGLKKLQQGGAQVSTLHANWIVNLGGATAQDVVSLMDQMRTRVKERFGVSLTAEVRYAGRFD